MAIFATVFAFIKGSRLAQLGLLIVFVAIATLAISKCTGSNRKEAAQARQTSASGEAIANAAKDAVETVSGRSEAELAIDAAVAEAKKDIGNAQSSADIRVVVARELCRFKEYRDDPACIVRQPASR